MNKFRILDCTLRDGGYVNDWHFGKKVIKRVLQGLKNAHIDIVEVGFLSDVEYNPDKSIFSLPTQVTDFLPAKSTCKYVLMIALGEKEISYEKIPAQNESLIWGIRLTFHKNEIERAFEFAHDLISKGYEVFMQPVGTISYTDAEFLSLVEKIDKLKPYAFSVVDTLGNMTSNELLKFFRLADSNLAEEICIGFHSHNNLQLSFSNAQELLHICSNREIIIDASVIGMGRGAGNLCTELIARYMNDEFKTNYNVLALLEIIDNYLLSIQADYQWGYSIPYYISAVNNCHPNYATYLMNLQTVRVEDIEKVIAMIPESKRSEFDKQYITALYKAYQSHTINDKDTLKTLKELFAEKTILVLAPGRTLITEAKKIQKFIEEQRPYIISVNFDGQNFPVDVMFISNLKRFNIMEFDHTFTKKLIVTSNIDAHLAGEIYRINYSDYLCGEDKISDNAGVMLLNLLCACEAKKVVLAGFDGFKMTPSENYFDRELYMNVESDILPLKTEMIRKQINLLMKDIDISFLTTSQYADSNNE